MEGMISTKSISILIDSGSTLSYIFTDIVDKCNLRKIKHAQLWLVYLATRTKRKVTKIVKQYPIWIAKMKTLVNVNVLLSESYDLLIGMDWLEQHKKNLEFFNKSITKLNKEGTKTKI